MSTASGSVPAGSGIRVFVADPTSYIGNALIHKLAQDQKHTTVLPTQSETLGGASSLVAAIAERADVLILDLNEPAAQLSTQIITLLNSLVLDHELVVIGISSVLTWGQTVKSSKKILKESNYKARKPAHKYKNDKLLETLLLSAQKDNLFTYVVAAGVLYGLGEHEFHSLFQTAWLNSVQALPVIGEGKNIIPTIHVSDLATIVMILAEAPPAEQNYIVAVDRSHTSQKALVQAISSGLNTGAITHLDRMDERVLLNEYTGTAGGNSDIMLTDMKFEAEYVANLDFEWVAENGLPDAFETVRQEYVKSRGLKPLRIFVHGPPGSGKSRYSRAIASQYYLPHITIGDVINEALAKNDELTQQIQQSLAESGHQLKASAKNKAKKPKVTSKKNKTSIKEYEIPRISIPVLTSLVKRVLRSAACRNKGFVLDGYPRTIDEARALFTLATEEEQTPTIVPVAKQEQPKKPKRAQPPLEQKAPTGNNDGEEEEPEPITTDPTTMVEYCVVLPVTETVAAERYKNLPIDQQIVGHNDEEGFKRRWARYQAIQDDQSDVLNSPVAFLSDIELLELPESVAGDVNLGMRAISVYVEKHGKPYNYHPTPQEQQAAANIEAEKQRVQQETAAAEQAAREQAERVTRAQREKLDEIRRAQVLLEDRELVEAASQPLRAYLMSHVIPALVDGLLDVCHVNPEDPIDYLAEYLFKCSVNGGTAPTTHGTTAAPQPPQILTR